ncbi:hypothetical protein HBH56_076980 [Parastagonospora nodorum]|uniref:Uncharacterized protein n=1 Tax=Phaeosphaeria nodorum (strain SN15 / ATCC MYA-4574 / FGSC 10173) TaxID=321614 RepID=A0A7U2IBR8_PHANO|nr:hypothetical protein HBH56_076980 [Parastagonospora nodorum]QRD06922.1 hypothetical protein JI435_446570 [Parastagonospora nodorum SN15]KAH3923503.1 hypothetical protein HBH54_210970 [Parastagonospora nodorum]KAH3952209.1 hypothetical protein HBH53_051140 [Parastagonospora nodorum]KAH3981577.1 hypothetical protein HBH51_043930 [Parastagonospora nodorum]
MVEDKSVFLEVECNAISDRVGEGENAVSRRIIPVRSHRCMPSKAPGNIEAARCLELFEWCLWQLSRGLVMRGRRGAIRGEEKSRPLSRSIVHVIQLCFECFPGRASLVKPSTFATACR